MAMTGTLPTEIGYLSKLAELSLSLNGFTGSFPFEEVLKLSDLEWLVTTTNQFTGTITIPPLQKSSLQVWNMVNNQIYGNIPSGIDQLTSLRWFQMSNNDLSGILPPQMPSSIETLWMHSNAKLEGEMPCQTTLTTDDAIDFRSDCRSNPKMICPCCVQCM
jgi:Leucine-rich repeat (LRR) protein